MANNLHLLGCADCLIAIANADYTGMDLERETAVRAGINRWNTDGFWLAADGEEHGFCRIDCDVCLTPLAGDRFLVLALDHRSPAESLADPSPPASPGE